MTDQRITTPFGAESTAAEVLEGVDLSGKVAVVTGGASGIGVETVRALAGAGAKVTIAARNTEQAADVAGEIGAGVEVSPLDLSDLGTVAAFTEAWNGPLDILVNNAGVMAIQERTLNEDGHEMQFATNHLGHFLLATGLHGSLAQASDGARVVSVSSRAHLYSDVHFDDIDFVNREYVPFGAYGQSKTANVLFAVGATQRWAGDGIQVNALMPGGIATPLQRHVGGQEYIDRVLAQAKDRGQEFTLKTPEQGAATSVLCAASPLLDGVGGRYFEDCNEAETVPAPVEEGTMAGVATYALDPESADRLWTLSEQLTAR